MAFPGKMGIYNLDLTIRVEEFWPCLVIIRFLLDSTVKLTVVVFHKYSDDVLRLHPQDRMILRCFSGMELRSSSSRSVSMAWPGGFSRDLTIFSIPA